MTDPVPPAELASHTTDATETALLAAKYKVESPGDEQFVSSFIREIGDKNRELEALKRSLLDPLRETEKRIRAMFKPAQDTYEASIAALKQSILDYRAGLEVLRRAALAAAAAAATPAETTKALAVVARTQVPVTAGLQARKVWAYEIVDGPQVPREFLAIDSSAIARAINAGAREIPGLRIFQREYLASVKT